METKKIKLEEALPEEVLVKVFLAGFPLRGIARLRSVCKGWKSIIDSDCFRDLYVSLKRLSVSWSIMNNKNPTLSLEIVGHHGCSRWGLTSSLGSWLMRYSPETTVRKTSVLSCADGLVLLYTETEEGAPMYHVGNPLLQEWVRIPLPPHLSGYDVVRLQEKRIVFSDSGLVTKMEKGVVVGYKVVWVLPSHNVSKQVDFLVYSSETGLWETLEKVRCLYSMIWSRLEHSVPLNGILHWLAASQNDQDSNYVACYDFYKGGEECRVIPFPGMTGLERFRRTITTTAGFLVYCNVFNDDNGGCTIMVWRLGRYCDDDANASWRLSWKLNTNSCESLVGLGVDYFPVVMHPLYHDVIYLWSRDKDALVLLNFSNRKYGLLKEGSLYRSMDGCLVRLSGCKEYMDSVYKAYTKATLVGGGNHFLYFSQFVLPRWLNPLPRLSS
ncbi:unnamed protein product [Microthlaspi erraticum]|uniref:Uncharacterized protein n=1 Tax=Microthlaspi erraticum TaxID=1685480 RepID=A0A6D2JM79_9BRAS|nr:unnamed protein product [Microthlaspi erraticum]